MFFSKIALASALVATVSALTVSTPASLIECQPVALSWSGGTATPYYISILPGGEASATALEQLGSTDDTSYTWTVNLASGTNVTIAITDGSGTIAYSSPVVIQAGSSSTCLTSSSSASSTAAVSGSASAAASASTTGSTSAAASASASASAAASASSSSGSINTIHAAGAVAVVGAALIAIVAY